MRALILLIVLAACANATKEMEPLAPVEERVQDTPEPPKKKPPPKPTVIVVPTPTPTPPVCPPPAKTDRQQLLQALDCLYQIEKTKPK